MTLDLRRLAFKSTPRNGAAKRPHAIPIHATINSHSSHIESPPEARYSAPTQYTPSGRLRNFLRTRDRRNPVVLTDVKIDPFRPEIHCHGLIGADYADQSEDHHTFQCCRVLTNQGRVLVGVAGVICGGWHGWATGYFWRGNRHLARGEEHKRGNREQVFHTPTISGRGACCNTRDCMVLPVGPFWRGNTKGLIL